MRNFLYLIIACACWLPAQSQVVKRAKSPLKLADEYYAAGEYYTAAYLYEQYLNPNLHSNRTPAFTLYTKKRWSNTSRKQAVRTDILYKQAECYRLVHYWDRADSAYKMCTDNIDALYWQAVCERSLEKYDEAEANIRNYLMANSANRQYKEAAENELKTLQFIRRQYASADALLMKCRKMNTPDSYEKGAYAVTYAGGNQYLVSSTRTDKAAAKGANPNYSRLFYATLHEDSLEKLVPVGFPAAGISDNQSAASISSDGNRIYFTQWKRINGHVISNIYYSIKQDGGGWTTPALMEQVNTPGSSSKQPFCSVDGKYLFFSSDRPGGSGGFDIWYAIIQPDGNTATPINAGAVINTAGDEQAPFFHTSSGTLVFSSNGRQGMGGYDLFAARQETASWSAPDNLGYPVNSSRDDIYFFAPEQTALLQNAIIGSDRGSGCCIETYRVNKAPKYKQLNGVVMDCKNNKPVAGADVLLTDPFGKVRKVKTDEDGRFAFDAIEYDWKLVDLAIKKTAYKDTMSTVLMSDSGATTLAASQLYNTSICIDKRFMLNPDNIFTVFFDFDKSYLLPEGVKKLDSLYNILQASPAATIQISGYTDGKGTADYNKKLSDRRARACAAYLMSRGIARSRIAFEAFGACCPVEMEFIDGRDNPDGRARNRRALINIVR